MKCLYYSHYPFISTPWEGGGGLGTIRWPRPRHGDGSDTFVCYAYIAHVVPWEGVLKCYAKTEPWHNGNRYCFISERLWVQIPLGTKIFHFVILAYFVFLAARLSQYN